MIYAYFLILLHRRLLQPSAAWVTCTQPSATIPNALASHKQCVLLAKQSKDQLSEARSWATWEPSTSPWVTSITPCRCHEQHLSIAKSLGNKREEARAYSNLGSAYHYRRNFDKAMSYHTHVWSSHKSSRRRASK